MPSALLALSLSLIGVIASVPPPSLVAPAGQSATDGDSDGDYEAAIAAVDQANRAVNNDPEASLAELEAALEHLSGFGPAIAASSAGRETLDLSLLNLARALLLTGDEARAAEVMDQVIRTAHARDLPIQRFGPTLVAFHDARRALLDERGTAAVQVQCRTSCRVVIDAQQVTPDSGPLYLGAHRVWIMASDGSVPEVRHDIELAEAGTTTVIDYPAEQPSCDIEPAPVVVVAPPPPPPPRRILPRWAEISVAAIGLGAVVAGGVMLGLDGHCPKGLDPMTDAPSCPQLYEGTVPGLVAIGLGSVFVAAGAVTVSIDEVRINNQRGRQATLAWQMRF